MLHDAFTKAYLFCKIVSVRVHASSRNDSVPLPLASVISPFVIYSAIFLSPVPNMYKVDAMIFAPRPPTVLMLGCDS